LGKHDRPALLAELRRFRHQHRGLHERGGAQAERVLVATFPDDLVGQRLSSEERDLALLRVIRDCQAHVGRKGPDEHRYLFARRQFLGHAHGVARRPVVVARDDFQRPAKHASRGVDLRECEFHSLLVRFEKGRKDLVAVQFAELHGLRERRRCQQESHGGDDNTAADGHAVLRYGTAGMATTPCGTRGLTER
jgi:hypothetical protein